MMVVECPLCLHTHLYDFHLGSRRHYLRCHDCYLVMVPDRFHLDAAAEKAEYDKHQNSADDQGYRKFLSRTVSPLLQRLKPGAKGLDFGCGPGPTIAEMFAEQGYLVANYDPYYIPDSSLLSQRYDFITLTEVIEHIAVPAALLVELDSMLNKQGILAIMTKRVIDQASFALWHYKNDPTHINFYSQKTFEWIADKMGWRLEVIGPDVVFFHKD